MNNNNIQKLIEYARVSKKMKGAAAVIYNKARGQAVGMFSNGKYLPQGITMEEARREAPDMFNGLELKTGARVRGMI